MSSDDLRFWAGGLVEIAIYAGLALAAVILLPVLLIAGTVYLGIYGVRTLHGRISRDEEASEPLVAQARKKGRAT